MNTSLLFNLTTLVLISINLLSASVIKLAENEIYNNNSFAPDEKTDQLEERLDIKFENSSLKEIQPDVLQVIGTRVILACLSTTRNSTLLKVNWLYHGLGIEGKDYKLSYLQNYVWLEKFGPVVRMECVDRDNASLSNSTLIYSGDGKPPFLQNHGLSVPITVLNETTAQLPCLLNYPLDDVPEYELQLFKDGVLVENKNNCLHYIPEYGFLLNLTKLEEPYGKYECRVNNSVNNDFITMELKNDDVKRSEIQVQHSNRLTTFYKGDPLKRVFSCKVPQSKFENKFSWYFRYINGSYSELHPEKSNITVAPDPHYFMDSVKIKFSTMNVTHVVCGVPLKDENYISYNNSYAVNLKEPTKPKIVNDPSSEPIYYTEGKNITCRSAGDPVTFSWLKNGKPIEGVNITTWLREDDSQSTISLNPVVDDTESVYTCEVKNFLGRDALNFTVKLPENMSTAGSKIVLITIGICFAALAIILLFLFGFFQVKLRRRFSDEQIKRFFYGIGSKGAPYDQLGREDTDNLESVSYNTKKEIDKASLKFVKELKGGNFGKVEFGYIVDKNTNCSTPVAIKSIKDDPTASQDDIEFAFINFLKEIKIMQVLGEHKNVVKYIGAVTSDISRYCAYLVVEYCCEGDLETYLRTFRRRGGAFYDDVQNSYSDMSSGSNGYSDLGNYGSMNGVTLKTSHLIRWSEDIASGLEYIASKKLVHRDIAARNVLLSYDGNDRRHPNPALITAKISDFGLSKDLKEYPKDYYPIIVDSERNRNRRLSLPLRWVAVETLQDLKFTTYSDVWAFGVTLWEMFTLGQRPYHDRFRDTDNLRIDLYNYFMDGNVLSQPDFAPPQIYDIMLSCWRSVPQSRPDFASLKEMLHSINENRNNQLHQDVPVDEGVQPSVGYSSIQFVQNIAYNDDNDILYNDSESYTEGEDEDQSVQDDKK